MEPTDIAAPDAVPTVSHEEAEQRYVLRRGDTELGFAEYRPAGDGVIDFFHTLVHPGHRGHGNAERLVGGALADVRDRGQKVATSCWFVDQYVIEHPETTDLRA